MVDLTTRKLNWRPDGSYQLLNGAVEKAWDFGRGINPPESTDQLREILALDPKLKLLVGHGCSISRRRISARKSCSTSYRPLLHLSASSWWFIPAATCSIRATLYARRFGTEVQALMH